MEELDLKEILNMFWSKKFLIICITFIFFICGCIYSSFFVTPMYKATTTLVLTYTNTSESSTTEEAITQTDITLNKNLVTTYSVIIKSKTIAKQVISELKLNMAEDDFIKNISVSAVTDTEVIQVDVTNEKPETATLIANKLAEAFGNEIKRIYGIQNVNVVDEAEKPLIPYNINFIKDVAIFTFIGIILAFVTVFLIYYFDTTIKSQEEIEKKLNLPVLTSVPKYEE